MPSVLKNPLSLANDVMLALGDFLLNQVDKISFHFFLNMCFVTYYVNNTCYDYQVITRCCIYING